MTTTLPIVEFITARVADDEHTARNAGGRTPSGRWTQPDLARRPGLIQDGFGKTVAHNGGGLDMIALDMDHAEHMVRHNPNRVMVFVDVVRALVDDHTPKGVICPRCRLPSPCWTIRTLAMIWVEHPDYRPEWTLHSGG